jgi:glycosyltransferase involved in cell wall biosynthesis
MINNNVARRIKITNTKPEKFNILTFPTHERYETQLCKTGHNFYSFTMQGQKTWNIDQTPYPKNYFTLPKGDPCGFLDYDFILVQSKFWQFQVAQQINQHLNLPIICLEHTWPLYGVHPEDKINTLRQMVGNVNIFISETSANAWNIPVDHKVINHGVDVSVFKPLEVEKENHVLSVANDFAERDYCLNFSGWKRVTQDMPVKLIGNNEGLSEPVDSTEEIVNEYNKCKVFFNSSTMSPIPMSLLEAMACGCAVVSTATCMIPEIIENGVNGFISNDENELKTHIEYLMNNPEAAKTIGEAARQTILQRFSEDNFVQNWNTLFEECYEVFNI